MARKTKDIEAIDERWQEKVRPLTGNNWPKLYGVSDGQLCVDFQLERVDPLKFLGNNWVELQEDIHVEEYRVDAQYQYPCITIYAEEELNLQGSSRLHLACMNGSFVSVNKLVRSDEKKNKKLFLVKDKDGCTPLHIAAMKGRVDVLRLLLEVCPESIEEVNAMFETCLHTSVVYNKGKAIQYLLKWIAQSSGNTDHLINAKDYDGNTALHLAASRKQLQTLKAFLTWDQNISQWVRVNAKNSSGFTALDILYVLPYTGKIDLDIEKILQKSGALRTKNNADCDTHLCKKSLSDVKSTRRSGFTRPVSYDLLLVVATLLATITFQAALSFPLIVPRNIGPLLGTPNLNRGDSITTRSFVLFNSTGFIAAVATLMLILHQFPIKPWPQISISTMFGSYMCIINVISPRQALPLFSLSVPLLLLAAAGKLFCFRPKGFY